MENGSLSPGSKLGRYSILEPLGAGGMGVVYRARDEKLERVVAIKILAPGMLVDEDARNRFRKEALALAKLSHPHIAAVYDVGEQDGIDYIVMELVQGESLADRIRSGPLTLKDATSITLQVAQALEEAHERGVIHRDLKPANVMVTSKGQAKVLDFGLAKLFAPFNRDATVSLSETRGLVGTPLYMSPEQANGQPLDARTDLWSLSVLYYESLAGRAPFQSHSSLAILRAITEEPPTPLAQLRPDLPPLAERIVERGLQKNPAQRYQAAAEVVQDASDLLARLSATTLVPEAPASRISRRILVATTLVLLFAIAAGLWFYHRSSRRTWAREVALPQASALLAANKPLAALALLDQARKYAPSDPQFSQLADAALTTVSITSEPSGARVEIQDYLTPDAPWHSLGITPLTSIRIPNGYYRWKLSKSGVAGLIEAPQTGSQMDFNLTPSRSTPSGTVFVPAGTWASYIAFIGWVGPYQLPPSYIDRYEVTNRDYQKFVDSGGYQKKQYWTERFTQEGHELAWPEAMARFRDATDRPGPSTWTAGHYPEGKADYPVSGISWYEAAAYAAFAGKRLPMLAEWYRAAPSDIEGYIVPSSNIATTALAAVGAYKGIGPYGTYDMAGNVREWVYNPDDTGSRFILGGSWKSPSYLYSSPQALQPLDRSDANGFRCVKSAAPPPVETTRPVKRFSRDFASFKPVSDDVFHAYELLYDYPRSPLNATVDGIVKETTDWREEKVTFDAAYNGERMSAYLFLPKNVHPPYQTVIFFPSARVMFLPDSHNSRELGDIKFFDYIIQSGRAVIYPIYQDTYERRVKYFLPSGSQSIELTTDWYKDAARSVDYLATRKDIDSTKLAYLGVSMGAAHGVSIATLLQDRLKTAIFLDGGYFLDQPPAAGDQAQFAVRMKKPVLMVNGRYDYTFSLETAQNPLFNMLATPEKDKRHVILETPHDVTEQRPQLVKAVLDWLDQYMGPVGN